MRNAYPEWGMTHETLLAVFRQHNEDYEVCKYIRLKNGNKADVYNMEVVASLAFRLNTRGASLLRKWLSTAPTRRTAPIIIRYKEGFSC